MKIIKFDLIELQIPEQFLHEISLHEISTCRVVSFSHSKASKITENGQLGQTISRSLTLCNSSS